MASKATAVVIRAATPADIGAIHRFVRELAEFERAPEQVTSTPAMMHEALFGPTPAAEALVAEQFGGELAGFAIFYPTFSTWTGQRGIWLDDLYITPNARGSGAGGALLKSIARIAVERECARFEWWVLDWNAPAIEFYRSRGAVGQDDWTVQRVSGEALRRLAAGEMG